MGGKRLTKEQTEELIEHVRRRPYLYDVTDPNHADAGMVANAWVAITEKMGLKDKGEAKFACTTNNLSAALATARCPKEYLIIAFS